MELASRTHSLGLRKAKQSAGYPEPPLPGSRAAQWEGASPTPARGGSAKDPGLSLLFAKSELNMGRLCFCWQYLKRVY